MKRIAIGILLTVLLVAPAWAASGTLTTSQSILHRHWCCLPYRSRSRWTEERQEAVLIFRNVDRHDHL